jgi:hypothetical protein
LGLKEQEASLRKSMDLYRSALEKAKAVEDGLHAQLVRTRSRDSELGQTDLVGIVESREGIDTASDDDL